MKAESLSTGWTTLTRLPVLVARGFIRAYQLILSPFIGNQCRFHPSCSNYALEAIEVHGIRKGCWLALRRLIRCHPFDAGGFDPVPGRPTRSVSTRKNKEVSGCCPDVSGPKGELTQDATD
jgi:putative membrane protein insertion efficiency factor